MDYSSIFGRPLQDWKRDFKDFADNLKGMASEAADEHCGGPWHFGPGSPGGPKGPRGPERPFAEMWFPRTNSWENADGSLVFEFLLPGFNEKDISLTFRDDRLVLRARLPEGARKSEDRRHERCSFQVRDIDWREYPVPAERYDQAGTKAALKNGILTVSIPAKDVAEEEGAVRIEIVKEGE